MNNNEKKNTSVNFAKQATILAAAGIISKVIGMIYNIPMANLLGSVGNGYYGHAQTIYAFILLLASYSIPTAVSKIMAEYIEKKEFKNVKRIFRGSLLYVAVVGAAVSAFTYFAAPLLVDMYTVPALRVLVPTVFLSGFLSVYRGYFQAYGDMVPTSVSQIIEQIFNAVFSIAATVAFINIAASKSADTQIYGAAGGTFGTGVGVLSGLVFMLILFGLKKKNLNKKISEDKTKKELSYGEVIKLLLTIATPIIISAAIYNINVPLDMSIYDKVLNLKKVDADIINGQYGLYNRYYLVLANIPIAVAAAIASAVIPGVSSTHAVGNKVECNKKISQSMKLTMTLTAPCAVGLAVLGRQIVSLVYYSLNADDVSMVGNLLIFGGFSILLYGISSVLNGVLQGIGKVNVPVISSFVALILHLIVLVPMLLLGFGAYSLIAATAFYAIVVVIMNYRVVKKELGYKMEWKTIVVVPVICAAIMGAFAFGSYYLFRLIIGNHASDFMSNACATLASIVLAALVYFISLIKIGGYTREDLMSFPKGGLLVKIAVKLHLVK